MALKSIRAWLGVDRPEKDEFAPLRETLEALDHLEPDRARYLSALPTSSAASRMPISTSRLRKQAPWRRSSANTASCCTIRR
jgi:hypothetical protein